MTMTPDLQPEIEFPDPGATDPAASVRGKSLTIGAVAKALKPEFPEISISKIRYLEDQKLLQPKRTAGGYRLYSHQDLGRLRTILRLQRDEFLPLRVIRHELARGRTETDLPTAAREGTTGRRVASMGVKERGATFSLDDVIEETKADPKLVDELEEYGVIKGEKRSGRNSSRWRRRMVRSRETSSGA